MTEDGMGGWHHRLNGHEFQQTPGDGKGLGSLTCCILWGHKWSDMTEQLNNNMYVCIYIYMYVYKLIQF